MARATVFALLALMGCAVRPVPADSHGAEGEADGDSTSLGPGSATSAGPGSGPGPDSSSTSVDDSGTATEVSTDEGVDFIMDPDGGSGMVECHLHAQDCDRGFKCVPTATNGSSWNGTACVPIVREPQGLGDPCTLEDPATGVDDCGWGQFCWYVDPTGMGECIGLCLLEDPKDDDSYYCEDPTADPTIGCQDCFCICVPPCNPLTQDCSEGLGCYSIGDRWQCAPDASDGAGQDAPCDYVNACSPGHVCADPSVVPSCEGGGSGCCTALCDTSQPDMCPGQGLGMMCTPWYEEGAAPEGLETVGMCRSAA